MCLLFGEINTGNAVNINNVKNNTQCPLCWTWHLVDYWAGQPTTTIIKDYICFVNTFAINQ